MRWNTNKKRKSLFSEILKLLSESDSINVNIPEDYNCDETGEKSVDL